MPPRYIAAPPSSHAEEDDITGGRTSIEVTNSDPRPRWSGLLDASGVRLYRVRETVAVGFRVNGG